MRLFLPEQRRRAALEAVAISLRRHVRPLQSLFEGAVTVLVVNRQRGAFVVTRRKLASEAREAATEVNDQPCRVALATVELPASGVRGLEQGPQSRAEPRRRGQPPAPRRRRRTART